FSASASVVMATRVMVISWGRMGSMLRAKPSCTGPRTWPQLSAPFIRAAIAGPREVLGPHIVHIHPPQADLVFYLVPQVPVRREQVQGGQQGPADAFGPHGSLLLKGSLVAVMSIN